ncbi:hypothetical protein AB0N28_30940 [Streptomyces sp. NPDC051130]|uniref:hypothetical protein n=1 Tax=Streptomyces sp. NPDC051130 TaxID=3157223 RepID=UPI0034278849
MVRNTIGNDSTRAADQPEERARPRHNAAEGVRGSSEPVLEKGTTEDHIVLGED